MIILFISEYTVISVSHFNILMFFFIFENNINVITLIFILRYQYSQIRGLFSMDFAFPVLTSKLFKLCQLLLVNQGKPPLESEYL